NSFSLPEKIIFTVKPNNLSLLQEAITLKFDQSISIVCSIPRGTKQLAKLAIFNAHQVIENKIGTSDKYHHAMKNLAKHLGLDKTSILIEGYDISHHSGKYAVASAVQFSNNGPNKKAYKLYNIPSRYAGNDVGSIKHVLQRRLQRAGEDNLPDIMLIDGGLAQLNSALGVLHSNQGSQPLILSIVKGAKRVRATETILSKDGVLEIPKDSPGFVLLQQVRDESHRFAITSNRKKKNKSISYSRLDSVYGLGPQKKKELLRFFKSLQSIKNAPIEDLQQVKGISIKLANEIKNVL
ncbi:helix-hairpin-helix domain-containing protein, partial [Gammaproteobacteria bacterium]|nr:helix-hairpin-helix domain-containing protein [Gammaproteobacteria bacterium]